MREGLRRDLKTMLSAYYDDTKKFFGEENEQ